MTELPSGVDIAGRIHCEFIGRAGHDEVAIEAQNLKSMCEWMKDHARNNLRDWIQAVGDRCDDTEISSATPFRAQNNGPSDCLAVDVG